MFHLTITADDLDRFIVRPRSTRRRAEGWVRSDAPAAASWPVEGGALQPVRRPGRRLGDDKRMYYRLHFRDGAGHPLTLVGFKEVRDDPRLRRLVRHLDALHARAGRATSTRSEDADAELVAIGHPPHPAARLRPPDDDLPRPTPTRRVDASPASGACSPASCGRSTEAVGRLRVNATCGPRWFRSRPATASRCNLIHVTRDRRADQGAGAARARRRASGRTSSARRPAARWCDVLIDEGCDVWLENWRARSTSRAGAGRSTRRPSARPSRRGAHGVEQTGADEVRAVIHCQGSTSLHDVGRRGAGPGRVGGGLQRGLPAPGRQPLAQLKLRWMIPPTARGCSATWTPVGRSTGAPWILPKLISGSCWPPTASATTWSASSRASPTAPASRRCGATRTSTARRTSGSATSSPTSRSRFFEQILRCVEAGHLVSADDQPGAAGSRFVDAAPEDRRRASRSSPGELNACFEPESQRRTHAWFGAPGPGPPHAHVLPGYGHLDIFMGAHAAHDVFPTMLGELERT